MCIKYSIIKYIYTNIDTHLSVFLCAEFSLKNRIQSGQKKASKNYISNWKSSGTWCRHWRRPLNIPSLLPPSSIIPTQQSWGIHVPTYPSLAIRVTLDGSRPLGGQQEALGGTLGSSLRGGRTAALPLFLLEYRLSAGGGWGAAFLHPPSARHEDKSHTPRMAEGGREEPGSQRSPNGLWTCSVLHEKNTGLSWLICNKSSLQIHVAEHFPNCYKRGNLKSSRVYLQKR